MNLFELVYTEQPQKEIALTKQGGWVGTVEVGDVVNINDELFRVVGPPHYDTLMLRAEIENGYVLLWPNGSREYYDMQGELHRDDGPAVIFADGSYMWFQHGRMHREDGPAAIHSNGTEMWYYDGELHREDGPAVTWATGTLEWWIDGVRHREDGPAMSWDDGTLEWWIDGERHREDGPAVTWADGTVEYWLHGKRVEREDLP